MASSLDPKHTLGRIFGTDWTIANVAKLLRFNASQGFLRAGPLTTGMREINQNYLRTTSARHLPTGVAVTFRRDESRNWQAEICFADLDHYLPWNDALAEQWLDELFQQDRPRVQECSQAASPRESARLFKLSA